MEKVISGIIAFIGIVIAYLLGRNIPSNRDRTKPIYDSYRDSEKRIDDISRKADKLGKDNRDAQAGIGNAQDQLDNAKELLDKIRKRK